MKASNEMTGRRRLNSIIALAAMLVVLLFSSCYIIKEADHDCSGSACPICAMIQQCEDTLRQIGIGTITMIAVAAVVGILFTECSFAAFETSKETLITRKVRLNN